MISEQELEALSFPGAPKIVSAALPGPTSACASQILDRDEFKRAQLLPMGNRVGPRCQSVLIPSLFRA